MTLRESSADSELKPELRLLLQCAPGGRNQHAKAVLQELLLGGINWTAFAQRAVAHGLTSTAAHTLAQLVPDDLPNDILDAFHAIIDESHAKSRTLLNELGRLVEALAGKGIAVIPLKGPIFELQAYGGPGRREIGKLELLIRDTNMLSALATLNDLNYERGDGFDSNHRVPDQVFVFGRHSRTPVEPRTRLIPSGMGFDIDYAGLWERVLPTEVNGRTYTTLAPEDMLLVLALRGGMQMWRDLKSICDLAAFLGFHPALDWTAAAERARRQGCLRALLLAGALGRRYLRLPIPHDVIGAGGAKRTIELVVGRIAASWQSDEPATRPSESAFSVDRLRLHDGPVRRLRYLKGTALPWPGLTATVRGPLRQIRDGFAHVPDAKRYQQTRLDAKRVLARAPNHAAAWRDLGDALQGLRRYRRAIVCYDKALSIVGHDAVVWSRRTAALQALGRRAELAEMPADPTDAKSWAIHAERLFGAKRLMEAIEASDCALALDPDDIVAARIGIVARLCACDWQRRENDERRISVEIRAGRQIIAPFWHRAISDSEAESLMLARLTSSRLVPPPAPLSRGEWYHHSKIRIAYCSTDFRDHVVAEVMAGCFEHHDRSRFETTAISLGPNDGSAMRRRIAAAFDRFVDVQAMSDISVAKLVRELEIDVIIDLNGYSGDRRTGIFAHRAAPVQATFQGYAGTMGLPFYDYIIADAVVIPPEHQMHYSETVVYLPQTYMPQDRIRPIARAPGRAEAGLPETGFVFASHNNDYKLSPELFQIWMRLLDRVEGSVLWLKSVNPWAMMNLRREARASGIAPERLIFAPRVPRTEDHLARLQLADLFLDTRPYNAHATACDALRVGVPVVTCPGNSFASRVAASVLHAIGMSELVASSLADYEALALALGHDPDLLSQMKRKLLQNRDTEALFDTARMTRNLEAAYKTMWTRVRDRLPSAGFPVDPISA